MPFTVPNLAQAAYPAQSGLDSGDLTVLAAGSALTGVQSGCAVTAQGTPNMTVAAAAGVARIAGRRVTVTAGNVTITTADGTNPRHDLITVDTSGTLAAVAGTPAAITATGEPVFPAIPAGRVVLASVYVPAAATAINANQITDKRSMVAEPICENVKWYGATGDGTTDDTAAIAAAIAVAAAVGVLTPYMQTPAGTALYKGGGIVYFPTGTYIHTGLSLGNRVQLEGDGWGSILKLKAAANAHSVTNAAHAIMCGVRNLRVDGNATGQAATTVAAGSNGAAPTAATLNVASTTGFPTTGSLVVVSTAGPQQVDYTGVTGTTFTGCTSTGASNGLGALATGGAVQLLLHGIYWNFATTPDSALDEDYDGNYFCDHTLVANVCGDSYNTNGRGSTHIRDAKAYNSGRYGFRFDQDVMCTNSESGASGSHGFVVAGAGGGIIGAKAWYCGRNSGAPGWSGWVSGFVMLYCNNAVLSGCSAQDCSQHGLYAEGTVGLMVNGFLADSNNAGNANGVGISMWGTTRSLIIGAAVDNNRNTSRQIYAIALGGGNTGSQIIMSTAGNTGGDISATTAVTELTGNNVNINAEGAQTPTLFTTTTPSAPLYSTKIFARKRAGRSLTAQIDPTGINYSFQPSLAENAIGWIRPQGNGTVVSTFGLTPTAIGTATAANWATTNALAQARRISYISSTTAGTSGGVKHNVLQWWRGNAAGLGGWHLVVRFGFASIPATRRWFVGMMGSTTTPTADPSAITTMCGVGQDAADTNIQFMTNDASGTAPKSTGTTTLASPAVNEIWEVQVFAAPNASSIQMSVARLSGTFAISEYDSAASVDIPANTAALLPILYANNATTAAAIDPHLLGLYIETDI